MITCFIRYEIDPFKRDRFEQYARAWGQSIPRNGAELIGYFGPHEGSATTAYGAYNIETSQPMRRIAPGWPPIRWGGRTTNSPSANVSS